MSNTSPAAAKHSSEDARLLLRRDLSNRADTRFHSVKGIHGLFEAQVERTPEAIAAVFGSQSLTYHELNSRANQLAHRLNSLGVGPELRVGLYLERSLEMVVALLGVLKSGGTFLPLDPHLPAERVGFLIEDAGVKLVLTQKQLAADRERLTTRFCSSMAPRQIWRESAGNLRIGCSPDQIAYVIYTSGSTGTPKGAMIPHGSLTSHCLTILRRYGLSADDRVLQFASLSFDAALEQIFPPLLVAPGLCCRTRFPGHLRSSWRRVPPVRPHGDQPAPVLLATSGRGMCRHGGCRHLRRSPAHHPGRRFSPAQ